MTQQQILWFAARMRRDLEDSKRFSPSEQARTLDAVRYAADAFADLATNFNARFNRLGFMARCGL